MKQRLKQGKRVLLLLLILCMLQGAFGTMPVLGGKKKEVMLVHDNKWIKMSVPDGRFLSDGLKYSVHRSGSSDGWSVMTTILTDRDDLYELEKSRSFQKEKSIKVKDKYLIQYKLKDFYYPITILCTEKHKGFFENLTERDFKIGKKEYNFLNAGFSSEEIKAKLKLNRSTSTEKLKTAQKIIKSLSLDEETVQIKKLLKRQKAGVVFAEKLLPFQVDSAIIREAFLYESAGYEVLKVEWDESAGYMELKKGRVRRKLLLTEAQDGKKKTGAILVYSMTDQLRKKRKNND